MAKERARILVADDEYHICEGLRESLLREDHDVDVAHDGHEAVNLLDRCVYNAAVLDLRMPGCDGLTLLKRVAERSPGTGVILMTGYGEISTAVEAMRLGAFDFLTKPIDIKRLRLSLERMLEHQTLVVENKELRVRVKKADALDMIVCESKVMQGVCHTIEQAAMTDVPVLVRGETGTGKELVARAIHQQSARTKGPLVPTNCGAIPDTLFAAELFGHVRGAFTGAVADKKGILAAASGGTLFLDEVGEIPLQNQVDLLRVLEEHAFMPVGSTKPVALDARIIFATNRDLEREVEAGRFREDLYYRVNVVPVRVPLLRERKEDIPSLIDTFLDQLGALHQKGRRFLTEVATQRMLDYAWPGNVRELKNVLERIVVTSTDREVGVDGLPSRVRKAEATVEQLSVPLGSSIEEVERRLIEATLHNVTSNRKEAATILGISVRSLQYKLKKYRGQERVQ